MIINGAINWYVLSCDRGCLLFVVDHCDEKLTIIQDQFLMFDFEIDHFN